MSSGNREGEVGVSPRVAGGGAKTSTKGGRRHGGFGAKGGNLLLRFSGNRSQGGAKAVLRLQLSASRCLRTCESEVGGGDEFLSFSLSAGMIFCWMW